MNNRQALIGLIAVTAPSVAGRGGFGASRTIRSPCSIPPAEKVLTGTIKQFGWTNPHSWVWINVPNGASVDTWGIEEHESQLPGPPGLVARTPCRAGDKMR